MSRTQEEINEMISQIEKQKENVPEFSMFGDNNWEVFNAGIDVLQHDISDDEIYDTYDEDEDSEIINYALSVRAWLDGADNTSELIED